MASYTVKKGDSLWAIAQKNKTTVKELLKANPAIAQRRKAGKVDIYSGTKVRIPGGKSGASKPTPKGAAADGAGATVKKTAKRPVPRGAAADTQKGRPVVKPSRPATSVGGRKESGSKPMMTTGQLKSVGTKADGARMRRNVATVASVVVGGGALAAGGRAVGGALRAAMNASNQAKTVASLERRLAIVTKAGTGKKAGVATPKEAAALRAELAAAKKK